MRSDVLSFFEKRMDDTWALRSIENFRVFKERYSVTKSWVRVLHQRKPGLEKPEFSNKTHTHGFYWVYWVFIGF